MDELLQIFGLALLSAVNPALLAALTVMLLASNPRRLMLGYLLGAYVTSIGAGLVVVFSLEGSGAADTAKNTVSPAQDIVLGALLLIAAAALRSGGGRRWRERRQRKEEDAAGKRESLPTRLLGRGSPPIAFAVGILLSFPGASYLLGLTHIHRFDAAPAPTVLLVVGFCLIQLLLLELPLLGYLFAPERTATAVGGFRGWLARSGRRAAADVAAVLGLALLLRAVIVLA